MADEPCHLLLKTLVLDGKEQMADDLMQEFASFVMSLKERKLSEVSHTPCFLQRQEFTIIGCLLCKRRQKRRVFTTQWLTPGS